jgi:hypothetical protein
LAFVVELSSGRTGADCIATAGLDLSDPHPLGSLSWRIIKVIQSQYSYPDSLRSLHENQA